MHKWYHIFPKNTGLSLYVWIIFCILPFYFLFKTSSTYDFILGLVMVLLFFTAYRLSFVSKSNYVYIWVSLEMIISMLMILFYGYVYFALFLAFFIGSIQSKAGFITLYIVHLVTTIVTINVGFLMNIDLFFPQLPFIIITLIGVVLLPFSIYNRHKQEKLEGLLDDANKKISQLMVIEERQRIARDIHDTLGQKLSLIGLKSDLAGKLIDRNAQSAKMEIDDIHQTARMALKEVREMVADMRRVKLADEIIRVKQMLKVAQIDCVIKGDPPDQMDVSILIENVLSMCLKEAVTNVVKHSESTECHILIKQHADEIMMNIKDNGKGFNNTIDSYEGHGLRGMKERLDFINGQLTVDVSNGTTLNIRVPNVKHPNEEGSM